MLSCFDYMLLNLPGCPAGTRTAGHASGSIWATDVPGWITALATAGLLIGAIITAIYAIRAFREQTKAVADQTKMLNVQSEQLAEQQKVNAEQIRVLELQAAELHESLEERQREAAERRRAQASRVFIWIRPDPEGSDPIDAAMVGVKNTSHQPIYDLSLFWRIGSGDRNDHPGPAGLTVLMPDERHAFFASIAPGLPADSFLLDTSLLRASVVFRDAAGVRWRLRSDGQLDEEPVTG
jgi:hypothetical protein